MVHIRVWVVTMKLYREIVTKKSLSGLLRIRPHRGRLDEHKQ